MENKTDGYYSKHYSFPTKHYCQTLDLIDDANLIKEYIDRHSQEKHLPVIREGLKEIGILEMEIYIYSNHAFMIVETPIDFVWEEAFLKLSSFPQQQEWEEYMSIFQITENSNLSHKKWHLMDRIFKIYE